MEPTPPPRSNRVSCLAIACLVAAMPLWLLAAFSIRDLSIERFNVTASAAASIGELLIWLLLAIFVYGIKLAGTSSRTIDRVRAFLVLGGAVASNAVVNYFDLALWVMLTPWLMPPLVAAFGIWNAAYAGSNTPATRDRIALGFAILALPLIVTPFVDAALRTPPPTAQEVRNAELDAGLAALGPGSPLDDFVPYVFNGGEGRVRALDVVRTARTRQADAVRLLNAGRMQDMPDLNQFALAPTPELCSAYRDGLVRLLDRLEAPGPAPDYTLEHLIIQEDNIRWLVGSGCDLGVPVRRLAAMQRAAQSSMGPDFANDLEAVLANQGSPPP